MKCPYCENELISGVVQSAREIFFTETPHKIQFIPFGSKEISLSSHSWTSPTCEVAYHCPTCKKVIIDYSNKEK